MIVVRINTRLHWLEVRDHSDDVFVCSHVTGIVRLSRELLGGTSVRPGGGYYRVTVKNKQLLFVFTALVRAFVSLARATREVVVIFKP